MNQLYFKVRHGTTIGGFREDIWRGMFEQIIPKKFVIEQSVFIIDSGGRVSKEVDLAIFDETYTPYIFRYGRLKFLPIEAVAVTVQCKSTSLDQSDLKTWVESIAALKTSCNSYTRTISKIVGDEPNPTQTATRPLRILCCLSRDSSIDEHLKPGEKLFDFIIRASKEEQRLDIKIDTKENLQEWYFALNHEGDRPEKEIAGVEKLKNVTLNDYQVSRDARPVALLTLNLQLNQLLMLINNPILFPHKAYVKMFNNNEMRGDG